jgi:hypothetical protein
MAPEDHLDHQNLRCHRKVISLLPAASLEAAGVFLRPRENTNLGINLAADRFKPQRVPTALEPRLEFTDCPPASPA